MMSEYLSPEQAHWRYGLETRAGNLTEMGRELASQGIVAIEMPLSPDDFKQLSEGFAVCIEECPELLRLTNRKIDSRYGSEAGYTRKEKKVDERTGIQVGDPKNYFHFSESIRPSWRRQFATGPKVLREFLEDGFEIHDALVGVAKAQIAELEPSHPNISQLYFPQDESFSFLRLLRYDGYEPHESMGEVAKPHFDIGGVTIQAYADAPGFWAAKDGVGAERRHYDTKDHEAYVFLGKGHEKVYGSEDALKPLWHGVDRIIPTGVTFVPERTAVILFVDAPEVDYHVREQDTLPYLQRSMARDALVLSGAR
jgi:hypothetical protein